ncbi:MAG: hypothetical protein KDC88_08820 [Ignavibacteriae bacterium]|nr:hypothetical protein [Ignavibacteriota bacterium]
MKKIEIFLLLFILIFSFGCSSSSETTQNNTQTSEISYITTNNLKVTIPSGWKEIKDNYEQIYELWLVNDNSNASISFIPIILNSELMEKSETEKIELIKKIITTKRQNTADEFELLSEQNMDSKYYMKSLQFIINNSIQNSIIFGDGKKYYECLAYFNKNYQPSDSEIEELFSIQNTVVQSSTIE